MTINKEQAVSDASELLKLAERCEQATGPDHEIDLAIGIMTDSPSGYDLPFFTASLDAAMTLVPEGWYLATLAEDTNGKQICHLVSRETGERRYSYAHSLAGALCAAALRARALTKGEGDER